MFMCSYQHDWANFAIHRTRNHHHDPWHVGFLETCMWWYWEKVTKCSISFYLVHTTLPNYNYMYVTRILAHTLEWNFKSFHEVNRKFQGFFIFSIPRCAKGNQGILKNRACVRAYHVVQTLYCGHTCASRGLAVGKLHSASLYESTGMCFVMLCGMELKLCMG